MRAAACLVLLLLTAALPSADAPSAYQKPPEAIRKVLDLTPTPLGSVTPDGDWLLLTQSALYPRIADLAAPSLRLAGARLNPKTNGPQLPPRVTGLTFVPLKGGDRVKVKLPPGRAGAPIWSPDRKQFALTVTTDNGIHLWLGKAGAAELRQVEGARLNAAFGTPVQWLRDGNSLLVQLVPASRKGPPKRPAVPAGPVIQESSGKAAPVRTFQDLLRNPHDEALFDYYCTAQLARVEGEGRKITHVGAPAIFSSHTASPDRKYLLISRLKRPYSYTQPAGAFPRAVEVWDMDGKLVHKLADLPAADRVPIEGVPTGPRSVQWRANFGGAELVWTEALDGGDPRKKVPHRDRMMRLQAPFTDAPAEVLKTEHRLMGVQYGERGLALVSDYDRDKRRRRTFAYNLTQPNETPRLIWDLSVQDRYKDPGTPLTRRLRSGERVLWQDGDALFLTGEGATPKGSFPFLDRFDLDTKKATRAFQCEPGSYETVVGMVHAGATPRFVTRHESPSSPPNYRLRTAGEKAFVALTDNKDQAPQLRQITRRLVTYKREDGVQLSFTLYLPPGHKEGTRLPTVVWAYPREFNDPALAGQVVGSPNRYTTLAGTSHLFFLLAGYAVLDGAAMPVVGAPEKANDTFVEQIVASAKAAIDKAVELGVTDPDRVGVGGHSYGAFMTANLLAHSKLFRAGIARSGAYNRTLTPFGFQNERRTLWQAPEVYARMSPFMHAAKIKDPILLIHGEADNNPGTFPVQSDRLFQAIRGNGGTVRYVSLPHESHGYAARESVEHTLYEMLAWFDKHVKNAPPRQK